jgi:hypothetical protein
MSAPDVNFRSVADVAGFALHDERIDPAVLGLDPQDYADTLKFSHARHGSAARLVVVGGRENAVDFNRGCAQVRLEDCLLVGGGQCAVVIKGGSSDITLARVALAEVRGDYEIELGGWSDQSTAPTVRVTLQEVTRRDGRPVRVVVGRAERPTVSGCRVEILFWRSVALKAYWWAKRIGRALAALRGRS